MTHKIKILFALLFIFFFTQKSAFAQYEMDFEEFMGMMSDNMTDEQLDELSFKLPWDITVMSYGFGDFSGDSKEDIAISIREKDVTPKNTVDAYFFENIDNKTFKLIKKRNYKYFDVSIEIAFLVKEGKCYVTNRDSDNWYFNGYEIKDMELVLVDKNRYPIEFEKAGE
jgi:hypothetical protein